MLKTNLPDHVRKAPSDEAVSVIHAPEGFQKQQWVREIRSSSTFSRLTSKTDCILQESTDSQQAAANSDGTIVSPSDGQSLSRVSRVHASLQQSDLWPHQLTFCLAHAFSTLDECQADRFLPR